MNRENGILWSLVRHIAGLRLTVVVSLLVLTSILTMPVRTHSQTTTADLVGTVTDSTGAIVPGALVTVTNHGTGEVRHLKSADNGDFVVSLLPPGTYSVMVTMESFKSFEVPTITLAAGDKPRVEAKLEVGNSSETITVEATTPLLQSESSTMQSSVTEESIQALPLNGRNFVQLIQLERGANEGPPGSLTNGTRPDDKRQTASISANGQSEVLNNNMIDGMDNNERLIGTLGVRPSIDAIGELHVQTNVYSAEVGRTGGAAINIITKSGTNNFHGTTYEYFRNDIFNTYPYQFGAHNPKQELRQNQFGGSIGGPIIRNKTFFFGDFEAFRLVSDGAPTSANVPTPYEEAHPGDFSDQPLTATAYINSSTGQPYVLTTAQMDSAALNYFALYPKANTGYTTVSGSSPLQGIYVGTAKMTQSSNVFDVRGDHMINPTNTLFARFSYNNVQSWSPGYVPYVEIAGINVDPYGYGGGGWSPDTAENAVLSYIHTFSPNLLLALQAGYLRVDNRTYSPTNGNGKATGPSINAAFGMPNINVSPDTVGLAPVKVSGGYINVGTSGNAIPVEDMTEALQYQGTVTYTHRTHTLKFGSQVIRRRARSEQSVLGLPSYQFTSEVNLLLGTFSSVQRNLSLVNPHYRWWEIDAYAQDDYHVTRNLMLNLGVRYDVFTPKTDQGNDISNWNADSKSIVVAGANGVSNTTGVGTQFGLFSPRVGFAYTLHPGFVLRGGFGMSYFPTDITSYPSLKNAPFISSYGPIDSASLGAPYGQFKNGAPPVAPNSITSPAGAMRAMPTNYRPAEAIQYSLSTQNDIHGNVLTLAYVGVAGRHGAQSFMDLNAPPPGPYTSTANANTHRPYYGIAPNLTSIAWFASEGSSHYHSFQASLERRFAHGLGLNANYTLARELDNYAGLSNQNAEGYGYNVSTSGNTYEYGNSDLDIRTHGAATINYALPFGKNAKGVEGKLIGGWQANVLVSWTAGQPVTVTNANNVSGQAYGTSGTDRPNMTASPKLPKSSRGVAKWFNTTAFVAQTKGTLGTERRNQVYGPAYRHLDLSLFKSFRITESSDVEFRAEGFNITNTSNFAVPNVSLGAGTFGQLTAMSTGYQPRVLQFALKYTF